ncbi:hypothetical protein Zmor_021423 [Zophobas morio]|uniref:Uncharacterized protein n=1 Tax=Zophobas morio TaxID=2755281 RepID=A0AA38I5R1_9CUCU|nr:hypothetical protein Zmor_021423 [Zophobas morio]
MTLEVASRRSLQVLPPLLRCPAPPTPGHVGTARRTAPFQIIRLVKVIYMKFYTRGIVNTACLCLCRRRRCINPLKMMARKSEAKMTTFVLGKSAFRRPTTILHPNYDARHNRNRG